LDKGIDSSSRDTSSLFRTTLGLGPPTQLLKPFFFIALEKNSIQNCDFRTGKTSTVFLFKCFGRFSIFRGNIIYSHFSFHFEERDLKNSK